MTVVLTLCIPVIILITGYVVYKMHHPPKPKATSPSLKEICATPDGFFNLVKDSLPKDKALIYEMEMIKTRCSSWNYNGEYEVDVSVYGPIETEPLFGIIYNEGFYLKVCDDAYDFKQRIQKEINDLLLVVEKDRLVGQKVIVTSND